MSLSLSPMPGAPPARHRNEPLEDPVHLMWDNGRVLCGGTQPKRFWLGWTLNALNWPDLVCPACVQAWQHPAGEGR